MNRIGKVDGEIIRIKPFKQFIMSIGELPSSYMDSMTYYELLSWFCKFLQEKVIPAVNTNADTLADLQAFIETYFENLDVQEEINNKLDEMAETGQLAEIIAQYIELNGVLAFNTVAEMKIAENLVEGSILRTLGKDTLQDGLGRFYKVRTITSSDVVDEENIISLSISETLIAELINDDALNKIATLLVDVENLKNDIIRIDNSIKNQKFGILFAGRDLNDFDQTLGRTSFYWSEDGINLYKLGSAKDFKFDSHALAHIGDYFYCFGDNSYYYSKDLVNWTYSGNYKIYEDNTTDDIWSSMAFVNPTDDEIYIYSAYRYNIVDSINYHKITYKKATQNEDGTLSFESTYNDLLFEENQSFIDPYMYYDNVHGYIFAVANKTDGHKISVYHASSPTALGSRIIQTRQDEVEAPQLCGSGNGDIVMYCDFNNLQAYFGQEFQNVDGRFILTNSSLHSSTFPTSNYYWNADIVRTSNGYNRHLSPLVCDENTFQLVKEIGIMPEKTYSSYIKGNGIISDTNIVSINPSTSSTTYTKVLLYDYVKPIIKINDTNTRYVRFYTWFNHANNVTIDIENVNGALKYMENCELKTECRGKTVKGSDIPRFYTQEIGNISSAYPTDYVTLPFGR